MLIMDSRSAGNPLAMWEREVIYQLLHSPVNSREMGIPEGSLLRHHGKLIDRE
jgi:hypothetical protein